MTKFHLALCIIFTLAGCKSDNYVEEGSAQGTTVSNDPKEVRSIEIVNNHIVFATPQKINVASLSGEIAFELPHSHFLLGFYDYIVTGHKAYTTDGQVYTISGSKHIGIGDRNEIFFLAEGNAPSKITTDITTVTPVEMPAGLNNDDISSVLAIGEGLFVSRYVDGSLVETEFYYQGNLIDSMGNHLISNPVVTENNRYLFFTSSNAQFKVDFQLFLVEELSLPVAENFFKLAGDIYFASGLEYYVYQESSDTFEVTNLIPDSVGFIFDAERFEGADYIGSTNGVWKYDHASSNFTQVNITN